MTRKVVDFFRLIRWGNLLIIAATQVFAYFFLNPSVTFFHLFQPSFVLLLLATSLVAGGGYIINDYMDVMLDLVNKPEKVIVGKSISRRWAMLLHLILNLVALYISWTISRKLALMILACAFLLWIYSQLLKRTYLAGNLLVAIMTASTLWVLFIFDDQVMQTGIWAYSIFAFATTLQREIIKDTEDLRGDQKFKCRTLPIVLGIRQTKVVLFWIQVILTGLTIVFVTSFQALSMSSSRIYIMFLMYMLALVIIPMMVMAWLIKTADVKKDFTRLSLLSKLVMISGILSMIFWRY